MLYRPSALSGFRPPLDTAQCRRVPGCLMGRLMPISSRRFGGLDFQTVFSRHAYEDQGHLRLAAGLPTVVFVFVGRHCSPWLPRHGCGDSPFHQSRDNYFCITGRFSYPPPPLCDDTRSADSHPYDYDEPHEYHMASLLPHRSDPLSKRNAPPPIRQSTC